MLSLSKSVPVIATDSKWNGSSIKSVLLLKLAQGFHELGAGHGEMDTRSKKWHHCFYFYALVKNSGRLCIGSVTIQVSFVFSSILVHWQLIQSELSFLTQCTSISKILHIIALVVMQCSENGCKGAPSRGGWHLVCNLFCCRLHNQCQPCVMGKWLRYANVKRSGLNAPKAELKSCFKKLGAGRNLPVCSVFFGIYTELHRRGSFYNLAQHLCVGMTAILRMHRSDVKPCRTKKMAAAWHPEETG